MPQFEDFTRKTQIGTEMPGAYDCQVCDEYVTEALYNRDRKTLTWTCTNGHVSRIEEFIFG